jgi:hypothetical protein
MNHDAEELKEEVTFLASRIGLLKKQVRAADTLIEGVRFCIERGDIHPDSHLGRIYKQFIEAEQKE